MPDLVFELYIEFSLPSLYKNVPVLLYRMTNQIDVFHS